jgi:hypothetical protein
MMMMMMMMMMLLLLLLLLLLKDDPSHTLSFQHSFLWLMDAMCPPLLETNEPDDPVRHVG